MKRIIFTTAILFFFYADGFSQILNKKTLCKKWYLEKYEVMWIDYEPQANEKNDFIHLKTNMTYTSVDEGKLTTGKWAYNQTEKYFILYDEKGEGLRFFVDELKDDKMILVVDIDEMDGIYIYFKTKE